MNLSSKDIECPAWRTAAGLAPLAPKGKPRAKRFTGDHSKRKEWVREMDKGPGVFEAVRLPNPTNGNQFSWAKIAQREDQHIVGFTMARRLLKRMGVALPLKPRGKVAVQFTRYGPQVLDSDGAVASLKKIRDGVAEALGVDDADDKPGARLSFPRIRQAKAKYCGVRLELSGAALAFVPGVAAGGEGR